MDFELNGNHETVNNLYNDNNNNQKPASIDQFIADLIQQIKDLKQLISGVNENYKFADRNSLNLISLRKNFTKDQNVNQVNRNNNNQNNNINNNNQNNNNQNININANQDDQNNNRNRYSNNRRKRSIVTWIPSLASLAFNVAWSVMSMSLAFASIVLYSLITWLGFGPLFPPFLFMVINYAPFLILSLSQISSFVGGVMTLI